MAEADLLFGSEEVALKKFTDTAGVLRMREREPAREVLEGFEERFPHLFFAVYIGAFKELPSIRQFGFWLLNRGAFSDVDLERPNENGILLLIDVNAKQAGLTYGYALLPYLSEKSTFEVLSAAHPYLLEGDYLKAIKVVAKRLEKDLKRGWRKVRRNPDLILKEGGQRPKKPDQLLQKIREGNQTEDEEVDKVEVQ